MGRGKEHNEVRHFLLDVAKFKAGGKGVSPLSARDQEGGGVKLPR